MRVAHRRSANGTLLKHPFHHAGVSDHGGELARTAGRRCAGSRLRRPLECRQVLGHQRARATDATGLREPHAGTHPAHQFLPRALGCPARRFAGLWLRRGAGARAPALGGFSSPDISASGRRWLVWYWSWMRATRSPTLDRQLLDWFLPSGRPVRILLTKADKLSASDQRATLQDARRVHRAGLRRRVGLRCSCFRRPKHVGLAEAEAALGDWLAPPALGSAEKERPRHQGE